MKKIFILVCSCALLAACNNSAKTNKSAGADSTSIEVTDIHNAENSKDMAQHTYDNEAVQELLNWAKKMIETKNYPTERYQVNKCTTIIDGKSYLESLIAMISRNWENPTFHPTIEQLWEFREKWENKEA